GGGENRRPRRGRGDGHRRRRLRAALARSAGVGRASREPRDAGTRQERHDQHEHAAAAPGHAHRIVIAAAHAGSEGRDRRAPAAGSLAETSGALEHRAADRLGASAGGRRGSARILRRRRAHRQDRSHTLTGASMHILKTFAVLLAGALSWSAAHAQSYPGKTIRVIVPFAAGGSNDVIGRALQRPLAKYLNGNIVVENMPGASTKIGVMEVMKAAPDGHTLLFASLASTMAYYYSGAFDD